MEKEDKAIPKKTINVYYGKGDNPNIEIDIPVGTKPSKVREFIEILNKDILKRIPRGCESCHSGCHIIFKERYEHVMRIDLDNMKILEEGRY